MGERLKRLGAVAQAVYLGNQKGIVVGHTLLQKLLYFLQQAKGVDLGYRYRLYHYGPYCHEVWADLTYLEDVGAVTITASPSRFGYHICPEETIEALLHFADREIRNKMIELLDVLGHRSVRDLECLATAHYVCGSLMQGREEPDRLWPAVRDAVLALKPHLGEHEVRAAWQTLKQTGLL